MQVIKQPEHLVDPGISDAKISYIAREIAMDIFELPVILANANVTNEEYDYIKELPRFQRLLENEISAWGGALNTHERVKIKAAYNVEDWLSAASRDMHDPREPLSSRVQVARLVTQLAGMGLTGANVEGGSGERLTVTINLGADEKLKFEKEVNKPKVIDGEVVASD